MNTPRFHRGPIRKPDLWEFMTLVFTELVELAERMGIGDVIAIPSQQFTQDSGVDVNRFDGGTDGKRIEPPRRR